MPRNAELVALGAQFVRAGRTARRYRLFDLGDGSGRAGLLRAADGGNVETEVWRLTAPALGELVTRTTAPLSVGTVELEDGGVVKGFLCEADALAGARDVTEFGGWRAYTAAASP
jgi:allophanate hydrolase